MAIKEFSATPLEFVVGKDDEDAADIQPWVEALVEVKHLERWDFFHAIFVQLP